MLNFSCKNFFIDPPTVEKWRDCLQNIKADFQVVTDDGIIIELLKLNIVEFSEALLTWRNNNFKDDFNFKGNDLIWIKKSKQDNKFEIGGFHKKYKTVYKFTDGELTGVINNFIKGMELYIKYNLQIDLSGLKNNQQ